VSGGRLDHAVAAFLRQEFGASVTAIIGFLDILIEDARLRGLADCLPDLERMREAGTQLSGLIAHAVDSSQVTERRGSPASPRAAHAPERDQGLCRAAGRGGM
jgi:hypothetical protein